MVIVPPVAALIGFLGTASNGNTKIQANTYMAMGTGGWFLSRASVPVGALFMLRQGFLITRDLGLLHKFTNSTAHLNTQSLPSIAEINQMDNHHKLLTMIRDYSTKEGNIVEQLIIDTKGFRGYTSE